MPIQKNVHMNALQTRLFNCLETIVDLEKELSVLDFAESLLTEFVQLKEFMSRIDTIAVNEQDVERIERATASFLEELKIPIREFSASDTSRVESVVDNSLQQKKQFKLLQ